MLSIDKYKIDISIKKNENWESIVTIASELESTLYDLQKEFDENNDPGDENKEIKK